MEGRGGPGKARPYHRGTGRWIATLRLGKERAGEHTMTKSEYLSALRSLDLTPYSAAKTGVLGISLRQSMKYASGEQPISKPVELLLLMYLRYGIWDGIKDYLK